MKIKISIPGKTTIESPILKNTQFALIKGNELHINPDGYEGEVKIITLKNDLENIPKTFPDIFSYNDWLYGRTPFSVPVRFNPIFP